MILLRLRIFSIAKEAGAPQILTFGIISWRMPFTGCRDGGVFWVAGRPRLLPTFIAASHLPPCSPLTTPIYNRSIRPNVPTWLATLTRVSVQMGPKWARCHAGSIQVLLPYRRPVSLAMRDEIFYGGLDSRNLTQRCTRIFRSRTDRSLRSEWKLITFSTIRILVFRVIPKVRFLWEATGTPSSKMRRVISPITQAKS